MTALPDSPYGYLHFKSEKLLEYLKTHLSKFDKMDQNFHGCLIKPNPRLFPFHVYWNCVNRLSPILLFFPYLVLTMALILVLLERLLTRLAWSISRNPAQYGKFSRGKVNAGNAGYFDGKKLNKSAIFTPKMVRETKSETILHTFSSPITFFSELISN